MNKHINKQKLRDMLKINIQVKDISTTLDIDIKDLRKFLLENNIEPSQKDEEYKYFNYAVALKNNEYKAYFYKDLAELSHVSVRNAKLVAEMYDIKPLKKAYCKVCNGVIDLTNSKIVSDYCSKECKDSVTKTNTKKQIIKNCVYCAKEFEGKPNSKYCSDDCKKLFNEVEDTVKWLRG